MGAMTGRIRGAAGEWVFREVGGRVRYTNVPEAHNPQAKAYIALVRGHLLIDIRTYGTKILVELVR